jgi:hypothetical protein
MPESIDPAHLPVGMQSHRDRTITALCDHFTEDRLTVEEFERRLDVAARALTVPELDALLVDLPARPTQTVSTPAYATPSPSAHIRDHQVMVAIMGGVERRGPWQPAKETVVFTMMGGAALDFREVMLPPGVTEVTVICIMGGAEILVPPGLNVDAGGFAIMGGFEHRDDLRRSFDPNQPLLKIQGFALMGGVDVQVRLPGESGRDARRRKKDERRRLRE